MDSFDYVLIAIGVVLIAIGLFLFVAGKRDSSIANQVEGFGIKVNVSNPSIILIVLGIALVLAPRLLPSNTSLINGSNDTQNAVSPGTSSQPNTSQTTQTSLNQQNQKQTQVATPQQAQNQQNAKPEDSQQRAFFPNGDWILSEYEENGLDLSDAVAGSIRFTQSSFDQQGWNAQMDAVDMWGNFVSYFYQGHIKATPTGYTISILSSNDPSFVPEGPTQLIMKLDSANYLHMEYFFNGSKIILHFSQ